MSGLFRNSARDGLEMGDHTIQITPTTTVFPSVRDQTVMPDPELLSGRQATVYGKQGPDGVRAVLIIFTDTSEYGIAAPPVARAGSPGDGIVVELNESTPR